MPDVVVYEVSDRTATVTINRPEVRNAISTGVRRGLAEAMDRAGADEDVDVVILTGADPAFCAGVDLKELSGGAAERKHSAPSPESESESEPPSDSPLADFGRPIPPVGKPVIGAINGVAVTGGLELALSCDFLVASERAQFADTHARVGIQPGWGLTVLLPEAVGLRRAKEMSASGNFVDAVTALTWGLVNHVVPHEELLPFCRQLAADISSNDQAGVRRIFQTYDEGALVTGADAWRLEATAARAWLDAGAARPDAIQARRDAVIARGRTQSAEL